MPFIGRGQHRLKFRKFHLANALKVVVNLTLLVFKLLAIGYGLPFATAAYSKMLTEWLYPYI